MQKLKNLENLPRGIYLLPNLFTIGSIFAGFYAIVASLKGNFESAIVSIFIAMIMDNLDGRVARMTNTMTAFGAELDSLADMVSFAIAPAILAYSWGLATLGKFGWLAAFIYTVAVALRLARFNTQVGSASKRYFQGLPCPAAAAVLTSFVWIYLDLDISGKWANLTMAIATILIGVLMVSNFHFRSFKDADFKKNVRFAVILAVVLILVLISVDPTKVIFAISASYALSGPLTTLWELRTKNHQAKIKRKKKYATE